MLKSDLSEVASHQPQLVPIALTSQRPKISSLLRGAQVTRYSHKLFFPLS